ncbi:MAG: 4Fe-4S dicluster domain-containing protein [Planctomycetota bacterium]|jgi:molybdopterin-containing oxidoreductase family iron-sulfur binding subunit
MSSSQEKTGPAHEAPKGVSRRGFFRVVASVLGTAGGLAALGAAISPLRYLDPRDLNMEKFLQKHYKDMTPEEMKIILERIRVEVMERFQVEAIVRDVKPSPGIEFAYALNLGRCIGCRKCVYACVQENNPSRSPEIQYIRVLEMERGTVDIERGDHYYDRSKVPDEDHYYMPIQCHQCANPPCVKVCPIEATWQERDGITVIDYDWCIGCRYCEAACPYWARRFNFTSPGFTDPKREINPKIAYLSNRPRSPGVMEKCHFCLHRTREGRMPACLEVCPVGARKFGDLNDPDSEVSQILNNKHIFVLKQEVGTRPRFFYYYDQEYPRSKRVSLAVPKGWDFDSPGSTGGGIA